MSKKTDVSDNTIRPPDRWAAGLPAIVNTANMTLRKMGPRRTIEALKVINQPGGFDCPGCVWPEPPPSERHRIE